ncbi:MAG TPA: rod shape-determining protein MreC [Acidobacteriaceae bacterium]|jgi:rod shape-determining protein MreC|nr:rod shape-determining protein MreC [Acidobacteriaceae bacterium]
MESFYSRYRNVLILVVILLAQVIGLAVQVRRPAAITGSDGRQVRLIRYWVVSLISPFERAFLFTGHGIRGAWNGYIDLRHVRQNNKDLQAEVDRLRLEQSSLAEDALQGQRLQKLLGFKQQYIYQTVAAQVIGTGGTDQSRVLYIDKGSSDGIHADMPVVTPDGVVGKIRDVFPHTAQIVEINDQTSGLGVILQKTRLRGILRGNATGQPEIVNILPDERIQPGEPVITSGGDQVYPRGLPVGIVERVISDPDRPPYMAILVHPAARLARLEEVLVITRIGSTLPSSEETDIITSEQKAADILAERLPGVAPTEPKLGPDGKPLPAANPNLPPPPVQPPLPLHPDRFTPGATPPATDLTPGASYPTQIFPAQTAPQPTTKPIAPAATAGQDASHVAAPVHHAKTLSPAASSAGTIPPATKSPAKQPAKPTAQPTTQEPQP